MKPPSAMLMAMLALPPATHAAEAGPPATEVSQPRPFGHFLGEVLTQRIQLDTDPRNDPPRLPPSDRVGNWFERRTARVERSDDGKRWLMIDYQIVNAPPVLTNVQIPAVTLTLKDGRVLETAAWTISLGPMTPPTAGLRNDPQGLRPDRLAAPLNVAGLRRLFHAWSGLFGLTLAVWSAWSLWRNRRDAAVMPFARALRSLEKSDTADPAAGWIAVHRALNSTAGRVVHAGSLQKLLDERPSLQPLRVELQEFYRQSSELFYSPATLGPDRSLSLLALCRKLRRIEKRGSLA